MLILTSLNKQSNMDNNNNFEQTNLNDSNNMLEFIQPEGQTSSIKVIGVGGGGCNAVNHMYRQGIAGVDFIVCNTDKKALNASPVECKIELGVLGAGNRPERAQRAAERQADEIREILSNNTKMLYITAGMGGGTGTGAAPVIAKIAKGIELVDEDTKSILVVAVVTTPFTWEGPVRLRQAEAGIKELRDTVDSMIVINNDKILSLDGNMLLTEGFVQANNVLFEAVKGISDIITGYGIVNRDFQDVNTVMEHSGRALMGSGIGKGENRANIAIKAASTSVLLNDSSLAGAQNMLLYFYFNQEHGLTMNEMGEVSAYLRQVANNDEANIIWGSGFDESLDDELRIVLIATGIDAGASSALKSEVKVAEPVKQDGNTTIIELEPTKVDSKDDVKQPTGQEVDQKQERRIFTLEDDFKPQQAQPAAPTTIEQPRTESMTTKQTVVENSQILIEPFRQREMTQQTVQEPVAGIEVRRGSTPSSAVQITPAAIVQEQVMPRQSEAKSVDVSLINNRADRVKHLYDLLHNHPDGPQMVENLTTEQLLGEAVVETPHSSVSDVPKTKVDANGTVVPFNSFLYTTAD